MSSRKLAVVAVGSTCLIKNLASRNIEDQYRAAKELCLHLADLIGAEWDVVIGHGSRPQVDYMLLRSEIAHKVDGLHEVPLDTLMADTQGAIGYWMQQNLQNILARRGIKKNVVTIVTQTLVDREDPAFQNPNRPIGGFVDEAEARRREKEMGWKAAQDPEKGWASVVAEPRPKEIVELDTIRTLVRGGTAVITAGGGGIPVIDSGDGQYSSVPAVVNNDHTCSLLARELQADLFLVLTAVPKVALHYGAMDQKAVDRLTLAQAKQYLAEGIHFGGGMTAKIEAVIDYLESGGQHAVITSPSNCSRALHGEGGTHFFNESE